MSKTTGMTGLQQGLASGTKAGSEGFASRLEKFRRYAPIQATDFNIITDSQKQKRKADKFTETALGMSVNPSNTNLYESHYQYSKDKANLLFSDEVIAHYAKDQRGMIEWSQKVDALNAEISGYEAYYEDSFGDPSTADGTGSSWSDKAVRAKHPGGEAGFWSDRGVEPDVDSKGHNDRMMIVDSRQHSNMTWNFETGEVEYEKLVEQDGAPIGIDPFVVNPQTANELFSFNLIQTVFESPTDYAVKEIFTRVAGSREQFDDRMEKQKTSDSFLRTIADNYLKQNPNSAASIDEAMQNELIMKDAFDDFKDQTWDYIKENERIIKRKANEASSNRNRGSRPAFGGVQETGDEQYPRSVASRVPAEFLVMKDGIAKTVKSQNIFRGEGEKLYIKDKDGNAYFIEDTEISNTLGNAEYLRISAELLQGEGGTPPTPEQPDPGEYNELQWDNYLEDVDDNAATELKEFEKFVQGTEESFVKEIYKYWPEGFNITHGDAKDDIADYKDKDDAKFDIAEKGMGNTIKITNRTTKKELEVDVSKEADTADSREIAHKIFKFINNIE
jgi:hypothetical protein